MIGPKQALALIKDTFKEFFKDEATWMAAALSYFTVFALAPLLVILLQVASLIWDATQVREALTGQFQAVMGQEVARQVQTMSLALTAALSAAGQALFGGFGEDRLARRVGGRRGDRDLFRGRQVSHWFVHRAEQPGQCIRCCGRARGVARLDLLRGAHPAAEARVVNR